MADAATVSLLLKGKDEASGVIRGVTGAVAGIAKAAAAATVAIGAVMVGVGIAATKAASDVAESQNKVNVVFGKSAGVIDAFAKTSAQAFGMSRGEALAFAGTFGNLFRTMGLGEKAAAGMSTDLLRLASDLGSFNNLDTADVLEKMRAGLVGESEPMRALGININETAVAAKAASMGLGRLGKSGKESSRTFTDAEKVQARYALMIEQSKTATNDFANTRTGMANASKIITASVKDISVAVGEKLLPVIAPFVSTLADKLPGVLSRITPLLDTFGKVVAGIAAQDSLGGMAEIIKYFTGVDLTGLVKPIEDIAGWLKGAASDAGKLFSNVKTAIGSGDWSKVWDHVKGLGSGLFTVVKDQIGKVDWAGLWTNAKVTAAGLAEKLKTAVSEFDWGGAVSSAFATIKPLAIDYFGFLYGKEEWSPDDPSRKTWSEGFIASMIRQIDEAMGSLATRLDSDPSIKATSESIGLAVSTFIGDSLKSLTQPGKNGEASGMQSLGESIGRNILGPLSEGLAQGFFNAPPGVDLGAAFLKWYRESLAYALVAGGQTDLTTPVDAISAAIARTMVGDDAAVNRIIEQVNEERRKRAANQAFESGLIYGPKLQSPIASRSGGSMTSGTGFEPSGGGLGSIVFQLSQTFYGGMNAEDRRAIQVETVEAVRMALSPYMATA